jgi:hypothetical protein
MPAGGMIAATGNGSSARPRLGSSIDYRAIRYMVTRRRGRGCTAGIDPQRPFAALPQSFRSRRLTGLVVDIVKTALMTHGCLAIFASRRVAAGWPGAVVTVPSPAFPGGVADPDLLAIGGLYGPFHTMVKLRLISGS